MPDFNCIVNGATYLTVCSFNGTLNIQLISFAKVDNKNKIILSFYVFPPLHVFGLTSPAEMLILFGLTNPLLTAESVDYDPANGIVTMKADYSDDLDMDTLEITFNPNSAFSAEYSDTPNQVYQISINLGANPFYFISKADLLIGKILEYFCYWLVGIAWFGIIVGVVTRKLAGIEAMFAVQWFWLNIVYLKWYYIPIFSELFPLKYSMGFSHKFVTGNINSSSSVKFTFPYLSCF